MSLLSTQMISIYSSQRHYDTPRWFGKQRVEEAYEQCAGFLRIPGAKNPLDNSAVHPERYALVEQMT